MGQVKCALVGVIRVCRGKSGVNGIFAAFESNDTRMG